MQIHGLVGSAVLLAAAAARAGEPPGVVSHYEAEGSTNDRLGANDAAAVGSVTYAPGAVGQAFSLDGSGHVEVSSPTFGEHAGAFTVCAWIRIGAWTPQAPVFNFRTPANASGFTIEQQFGTTDTMLLALNQTGVAEDFAVLTSPGWKAGVTYHVAATFDAVTGTMVLYRDGRPVAWDVSLPRRRMAVAGGESFEIGRNIRSGVRWNGLVDDVRFYRRALSAAEVASIARPSSLVAHWRFDEAAGATIARDDLGLRDGTLSGGAAFAADGVAGGCISLSQATNSLVNMGAGFPEIGLGGDFTVVAWVKTTTGTGDAAVSRHVSGSENGFLLFVNETGGGGTAGTATFYVSEFANQAPTSSTTVTDGAWHQIAGVWRGGGTHEVYVDGAPAEASRASNAWVQNVAPLLVGGVEVGGVPTGSYTGKVDELQIYAATLASQEIQFLFDHPGSALPSLRSDLATDWSDDVNPSGAWIYREGENALPRQANWGGPPEFAPTQPAWARGAGGSGIALPGWYLSRGSEGFADADVLAGDVVVHSTDGANGAGSGPGNVISRSGFAGVVNISGNVWPLRDIGRGNTWAIYRNDVRLTGGTLASGGAFDRAHPFAFSAGDGGAAALTDVPVQFDDEIRLEVVKTSEFGDYAGTSFTIGAAPAKRAIAYVLVKSVKLRIAGPGKDSLTISGIYDDGNAAVDLTKPVLVDFGGPVRLFDLAGNAGGTVFASPKGATSLVVKPRLKGSSRGTFVFKQTKADLAALGTPDELLVSFVPDGLPPVPARVKLANGSFKLGAVRGSLVQPYFFPVKAKVSPADAKPDALAVTAGFASDGPTPNALGRVTIGFGPVYSLVLDGGAFTKSGDLFSFSSKTAAASISVKLDFAKGLVTVKTKGVETGPLDGPLTEVSLRILGVGDEELVASRVKLAASGTKRSY